MDNLQNIKPVLPLAVMSFLLCVNTYCGLMTEMYPQSGGTTACSGYENQILAGTEDLHKHRTRVIK